ncbi:MAG: FHA domain-containing protein [Chloroflexi bacterium]|nr:FHA domain-containing protein [Chloroflexota bacterium]
MTPITTMPIGGRFFSCPRCNYPCPPGDDVCPECGTSLRHPSAEISAHARSGLLERERLTTFASQAQVICQGVPGGQMLTLPMDRPVVLGRGALSIAGEFACDLTEFNALEHGVSRRHCQFKRQGHQLWVTDLESANGTFLNGQLLYPRQGYVVAHQDRLMLGELQFVVFFLPAP